MFSLTDLVMFVDSVEDDEGGVFGDLKLGVGHRRPVVHHHYDVFGLRTHCRHVHRPGWRTHNDQTVRYHAVEI